MGLSNGSARDPRRLRELARKVTGNVTAAEAERLAGTGYPGDHRHRAEIAYDQLCQAAGRRLEVGEVMRLARQKDPGADARGSIERRR